MSDSESDILQELGQMKIGFNKKRHSEKLIPCSICGKKVRKDYITKHKRRAICRSVKRSRADYLKQKVECKCGKMIRRDGLSSHKKRCKKLVKPKKAVKPKRKAVKPKRKAVKPKSKK